MGLLAATKKAAGTRRRIALISIVILIIILSALYIYDATIFNSLISYINDHGGKTLLLLTVSAAVLWLLTWISKTPDRWKVVMSAFVTILAFLALFFGGDIGLA